MKPKVFIAKPIPVEVEEYIAPYCEYKIWDQSTPIPHETLLEEVKDVVGLITPKGVITKEFLDHAPQLKIVSNIAVGYDAFDINAMKERKVIGTNTPYVLDETVADLTFGLMLSVARRLPELDKLVKEGSWKKQDVQLLYGTDVHHTTLGIIGLGRIGEKIARRASLGFEMNVLYHNRSRRLDIEEKYGITYCELDELLRLSDFVLLMLPYSRETHHLMGEREFNLMKSTAYFINSSRGKTVNESELINALRDRKIRGAALDVFDTEPIDVNNPLLTMKNVVTTPHIGSATEKTRFDMAMKAAENMVEYLKGNLPPNIVKELQEVEIQTNNKEE